jgi:hypothetical protein
MLRKLALIAFLPLLLVATPASAAADKAETCKIGADDQKLEGAKRDAFIAKCMAKGNYQPKARKDAMKKNAKPKAPAAPAAAAPPASYKPQ